MAKPVSKKKDETGIFSIEANPFDEGEIPGVTQLLTRPALNKTPAAAPKKVTTLEPTSTGQIKALNKDENTKSSISITFPKSGDGTSPGVGTRTNLVTPSTLKLKDLGVLFELKFHGDGAVFRYASSVGHKEARLLPWQEKIFERIKMDKRTIPAKEPFEEFRADVNSFLFEAFGIQHHHVISIVSPEYTNTRIVLVSEKSLAEHVAAILEHYSKG